MTRVEIGTDGACSGNPGPGGWGFVSSDGSISGYGKEADTTNQRMEVMAVARALLALGKDARFRSLDEIVIVTDSRYVVDCFEKQWHVGWERRGWLTAAKKPVKHEKLWKNLLTLVRAWEARGATVRWQWVKGHAGHPLNEAADVLAVKGRDEAKLDRSIAANL